MVIEVAWYKIQVCFSYTTACQPTMRENKEYMESEESLEVDAITLKPGEHLFLLKTCIKSCCNVHIRISVQSNKNL